MRLKALGIIEPPGLNKRIYPGERFELDEKAAVDYLNRGLAEVIAEKPSTRAEKRPKPAADER